MYKRQRRSWTAQCCGLKSVLTRPAPRAAERVKKQKNKDHKGEMHMEKMFTAADFDTEVLGSDKPVLVCQNQQMCIRDRS